MPWEAPGCAPIGPEVAPVGSVRPIVAFERAICPNERGHRVGRGPYPPLSAFIDDDSPAVVTLLPTHGGARGERHTGRPLIDRCSYISDGCSKLGPSSLRFFHLEPLNSGGPFVSFDKPMHSHPPTNQPRTSPNRCTPTRRRGRSNPLCSAIIRGGCRSGRSPEAWTRGFVV
jgi:hypothetical protein